MKKLYSLTSLMVFCSVVFSQSPEKMSYQAVVRDGSNKLVTNTFVGMQIRILQGSKGGTAVYTETHTEKTNANGLISIELGTGTTSDDFSVIDWASGPYFIKTETDPGGGSNYTITGISQLLSVPYALHAKTSDNVTGTTSETDPVFGAHVANGITSTNITNWNLAYTERLSWDGGSSGLNAATGRTSLGLGSLATLGSINNDNWSGTDLSIGNGGTGASNAADARNNLGLAIGTDVQAHDADLDDLADGTLSASRVEHNEFFITSAGTNGQVWTSDGNGRGHWTTAAAGPLHYVGEFYGGGIVFWVDETGEHGLISAKQDQSTAMRWFAGNWAHTRASGDGPLSGEMNTTIIIAAHVSIGDDGNPYAARICAELQITEGGKTYGDWYLPSREELDLMYNNRSTINSTATANGGSSFSTGSYWSSNESNSEDYLAWQKSFNTGSESVSDKENTNRVRAVRAY